jgi:hypothetical protein
MTEMEVIGQGLGIDWALFGLVALCLFLFGVIYNGWMTHLGESKEGYVSFLVAIGVILTLAAGAMFYPVQALAFLMLFTASGLPMIIGDIARYQQRRREAIERIKREAVKGDGDQA